MFTAVNKKWDIFCLECRKDTENTNPRVLNTSNDIISMWNMCE